MKKNLIIITILFMLLGVFGISQINSTNQENEVEVKEIAKANEEKEEIKEELIEELEEDIEGMEDGELVTLSTKDKEYTGIENIKVVFEKEYTDEAKYYLVVTAYDINTNKVLWSYKSNEDYVGQLDYIDYVYDDIDNRMVYIVTENTISKLDMTTGKVLWSNKLGVKLYSGIGHGNKLYFMGAYDDTMHILDTNKGSLVDSIKVNEGEYTYEFITGMADVLVFGYFDGTVNYIEFDTITNTIINE